MKNVLTSIRRNVALRVGLVMAVAMALAVGAVTPANASLKSSGIVYTSSKGVSCPSGQYGYLWVEGGHVSYKKVYHKDNVETHWSSTVWTGYNGGDALVKILGKTGGGRYARGYLAIAPDTAHGMSSMSKLSWFTLCDSRDLTGSNYGDALNRLIQVWRSSYWKVFR